MRRLAVGIGLLFLCTGIAAADTGITLLDSTTHQFQLFTPPAGTPLSQSYRLITPVSPGAAGSVLAVQSVSGSTYTLTFSTSAGVADLNGVAYKNGARLATANVLAPNTYNNGSSGVGATLTGSFLSVLNIDGKTTVNGDRVLVKNEADGTHNGIYTVTDKGSVSSHYILTRSTDFDQPADIPNGSAVFMSTGNSNANTLWALNSTGPFVVGTSTFSFIQISGSASQGLVSLSTGVFGTLDDSHLSANVPLLNAANTWSAAQAFNGTSDSVFVAGISVASITTTGSGTGGAGVWSASEGNSQPGEAGSDVVWADSATHWMRFIPNNTTSYFVVGTSVSATAGDVAVYSASGSLKNLSTLDIAHGGLGLNTLVGGDLLYGSPTVPPSYDRLAFVATATRYLANTGVLNTPAWDQINLSNGVTGSLSDARLSANVALLTSSQTWTGFPTFGSPSGSSTTYGLYAGSATLGTPLAFASGGLGFNTAAVGDLLYSATGSGINLLNKNTTATRYLANTGIANLPKWDQINLTNGVTGTLPAGNMVSTAAFTSVTNTFTSSQTVTSTFTANSISVLNGVYYSTTAISNNYTALCTDAVILASAPTSGLTVTLHAVALCPNYHDLTIVKVDRSSGVVTILAASGEVVAGTGTLKLNAFTQSDHIMSTQTGWIPWGQGLQITPPYYNNPPFVTTNTGVAASSNIYVTPFYTAVPVVVTGWRTYVSGNGCNIDLGVYDLNGSLMGSLGSTAMPATGSVQTLSLSTPFTLTPGWYYEAYQASNVSCSSSGFSTVTPEPAVQVITAASMGLPATITPAGGSGSTKHFLWWGVVSGGSPL